MSLNISYADAVDMLNVLPYVESAELIKRSTVTATLGWISLGMVNLGVTGVGFFMWQTSCSLLSAIPGVGIITGSSCVATAIGSVLLVAGAIDTSAAALINLHRVGVLETATTKRCLSADYNHYSNLTHIFSSYRKTGIDIDLLNLQSAHYYTVDGSVYGINASSEVTFDGITHYIQHGTSASRVFIAESQTSNLIKWADLYGNGYDGEIFSTGVRFKGQWCHEFGPAESLDSVDDWSSMNTVVCNVHTGNSVMDLYESYDENYGDRQSQLEVENSDGGSNTEWSEMGICDYPES